MGKFKFERLTTEDTKDAEERKEGDNQFERHDESYILIHETPL